MGRESQPFGKRDLLHGEDLTLAGEALPLDSL